jgi:DNA topoisomerase-6 subunit A
MDGVTVDVISETANGVYKDIARRSKPDMAFPVRSLRNVSYSQKKGYFEIGRQKKTRTLTVNTVKSFAQTLRMMGLSKELVETNDFATKRDAYYQSKNWEEARFDEQSESDAVMDDMEALFSVRGLSREQLRFVPDEHGGAVAGRLVVLDPDRETGQVERIDCTRFGSGAYSIPSSVEHLSFETDARFILAIETGGIFQRLQSHKFWQSANCILVSMAGVPTRATRRFIRARSRSTPSSTATPTESPTSTGRSRWARATRPTSRSSSASPRPVSWASRPTSSTTSFPPTPCSTWT